ncbi:MAG: HAD family acid phosphatase [Marinagarivorans sp.]
MPDNLREMTSHNNLHAVLFNATSAEYIALCHQAYRLARLAVLEKHQAGLNQNMAVVLDLDETVLDNSVFQASLIAEGKNFSDQYWNAWCDKGEASAVPGAIQFLKFIKSLGIVPIFITSRSELCRAGTLNNLIGIGALSKAEYELEFNLITQENRAQTTKLFMKGTPGVILDGNLAGINKFDQRIYCERVRGYEIILSIGDNLSDYAEYYGQVIDESGKKIAGKHPSVASRKQAVLQDVGLFGEDFILIPNPTYGGWLRAFEGNKIGASDELAPTAKQVRQGLVEPIDQIVYESNEGIPQVITASAAKLSTIKHTF